jgi:hypothetical protein
MSERGMGKCPYCGMGMYWGTGSIVLANGVERDEHLATCPDRERWRADVAKDAIKHTPCDTGPSGVADEAFAVADAMCLKREGR